MDTSLMTDDQIMQSAPPELPADAPKITDFSAGAKETGDDDDQEMSQQPEQIQEQQQEEEKEQEEQAADPEQEKEVNPDESDEIKDGKTQTDDSTENTDVDAKEILAKLFTPFTANGKEIKVDNVDDAIRLMQMGAGFNKKMAALKPHLKIVKLLDQHGLLEEGKLNHLIDISKKNPAAISKLLAESNIDPLNLDPSNEYTPNTYTVADSDLELDDVMSDLKDSPHYTKTLDLIVNKWDQNSKQLLLSNPEAIRTIHEQMSNGIYDQVSQRVERERTFGRLKGLSDLEAYKQVGDFMDANKLFAHQQETAPKAPPVATVKQPANESDLKSRKLAASPTKTAPVKKSGTPNFNPLTATDAEIANMTFDKFL